MGQIFESFSFRRQNSPPLAPWTKPIPPMNISSACTEPALSYLWQMEKGVLILDAGNQVVYANRRFHELYALEPVTAPPSPLVGQSLATLLQYLADAEYADPEAAARFVADRSQKICAREPLRLVRCRNRGPYLEIVGQGCADGGYALSIADITESRQMAQSLKRANRATLLALADLAEYRDNDTGEHVLRVARLTYEIGRALREGGHYRDLLTDEYLDGMTLASILHDLGKVSIPDQILFKPGRLDPGERNVMEKHAAAGSILLAKANALVEGSPYFELATQIARSHHERYDGNGYPDRLTGETIPLAARIVAVADVFDALISSRPYKRAWTEEETITYIRDNAGSQFDPKVVDAFLDVLNWRALAPVITWDASMSVGNEQMDADHRMLISLINQMAIASDRVDEITLELVLDELHGYTVLHFQREEEMLREAGYPDLEQHIRIHQALAYRVVDIRRRYLRGGIATLGREIQEFLGEWLRNHILTEDHKYIPHILPGHVETGGPVSGP